MRGGGGARGGGARVVGGDSGRMGICKYGREGERNRDGGGGNWWGVGGRTMGVGKERGSID